MLLQSEGYDAISGDKTTVTSMRLKTKRKSQLSPSTPLARGEFKGWHFSISIFMTIYLIDFTALFSSIYDFRIGIALYVKTQKTLYNQ